MVQSMYSNNDLLNSLEIKSPREVYRVGELIDPRKCEHAGYEEAPGARAPGRQCTMCSA